MLLHARSDDNGPVMKKMLYASSKDALKKSLEGIAEEYQVYRIPEYTLRVL